MPKARWKALTWLARVPGVQARQLDCGDIAGGQQQGIAAVAADVERHHRAISGLGEELVYSGRKREGGETVLRTDLRQGRAHLAGEALPFIGQAVLPGRHAAAAAAGVQDQGYGRVGLVDAIAEVGEPGGQVRVALAQVGEVAAGVQGLAEQHRPACFQQPERPLGPLLASPGGVGEGGRGRVSRQPSQASDRILLITAL